MTSTTTASDDRLNPLTFAKRLFGMQWQLTTEALKQMASVAPTTVKRSAQLLRDGKLPTPIDWIDYSLDAGQRWLLTLDTLRQRGNQFFEHEAAGLPPVLTFEYRELIDGRTLERPAAYSLLEIVPPAGLAIDPDRRPFVIVDPRAGHGPGIGGFKEDSEVGEALRAGHPVYMVSFYPQPVEGQTLADVAAVEALFLEEVARRHPNAGKPVVIGNCQGGWAVMGLAAARPGLTGPIVINGAPLSYWAGASGKNPMRYNGGLLGGSWMCQLMCDLGNGTFDGANLVSNFENLDLANTFWKKPFNLLTHVDTEATRFLEFERWWNGHYTLTAREMRTIVEELFVGNRLAAGEIGSSNGRALNLREITAPIVVFASAGDNITPPEQALNWIADVYGETREIVANGQVIVYLKHASVGHLGIFVSGSVAVKEHRSIVSLVEYIERLPPGLYEMRLIPTGTPQRPAFDIVLEDREIADIVAADRDSRSDENEFAVVRNVSDINSRIYDAFVGPLTRALSTESTAKLQRELHPARLKHYLLSDKNPLLRALETPAESMRNHRRHVNPENPLLAWRDLVSDTVVHWLDSTRITRDNAAETLFYATYGWMRVLGLGGAYQTPALHAATAENEAAVETILAHIAEGGITAAIVRALVIAQRAQGILLPARAADTGARLRREPEFAQLSDTQLQQLLREQTIVVAYAPERAVETLQALLPQARQRQRAAQIMRALLDGEALDERFVAALSGLAQRLEMNGEAKVATRSRTPRPSTAKSQADQSQKESAP